MSDNDSFNANGPEDGRNKPPRRPLPGRNPGGKGKGPDNKWRNTSKTLAFWAILILLSIAFLQVFQRVKEEEVELPFTHYQLYLSQGLVSKAVVIENEFHGTLREEQVLEGTGRTFRKFKTILPFIDSPMLASWNQAGMNYEFKRPSFNWMAFALQMFWPLLFIVFWIYMLRQMQGGNRGVFKFGKSKAKLMNEDRPKVTFADVAGAVEAKEELQEVIEFLRDPGKFQRLGGKIPRGALMVGPPGTGKTLLAKAVAGEAKVPFFSMSGSDFVEMFVGVGASRVRDLFEQGKKSAPCIIFIDEIDAVGRHRGAGLGGGHDEREQTLNQLLAEMDGFETNEGVIIIAATNRPDVLDPALLRPGRFDRQVVVDRPDIKGRRGILEVHVKKIPLDDDVDLKVLSRGTPGFSGADLANMVNEAALLAARRNKKKVEMRDLEDAKDKVMMGTERRSLVISDEEKRIVSYHESGHALVGKLLPDADPVHKVTIIPRGRALGLTHSLPEKENYLQSRKKAESAIAALLAGRIAEEIEFGAFTSGSSNDIERATDLARRMVCEWGMSEKLGPMTFGKKQEEIFLGREISQHRDYSEETAQLIDAEVKRIIVGIYASTQKLLTDNRDKLTLLGDTLLERELLDGNEIDMLLNGEELNPLPVQNAAEPPTAAQEGAAPAGDGPEPALPDDAAPGGDGPDNGEEEPPAPGA